MAREPINTRTAWRPVLRPIGRLLIAAQLALVLQPLSVLAQDKGQAPYNPAAQAQLQRLGQLNQSIEQAKARKAKEQQSPADRVSDQLARAHELTAQLAQSLPAATAANARRRARLGLSPAQRAQKQSELSTALADIVAGTASVKSEFDATRTELQRKGLPAQILARHDQARVQVEQRANQLAQIAARTGSDDDKVRELDAFFKQYPAQRQPAMLDPKKLPWSTPRPNTRMPAETKTAWYQNLYADRKVQLAQAGGLTTIGGIQFTHPPEPTQAPQDADLAETDEILLTPAIRAKAAELQYNPVQIQNWVRNTIDYAPTAGAIQSAQDTLDKKRGNALDTASLLIALLRASGVPARYQFGTIDLPAQAAMNWVGGATKPEAALQILAQGGIAARGLVEAGQIKTIRLEHVWVKAYVNWSMSRGAREGGKAARPPVIGPHGQAQHPHPNAGLNAWVPINVSVKTYSYAPGMDLKTAVPLDADALLAAAQQGATVNPAQGWVQNLNQAAIQSQLSDYQNRLKTYIDSTPTGASSTVGDVIGKKIIPQRNPDMLAGSLPYKVVQEAMETSAVPAAQQHKFTYKLYASQNEQANNNPLISFTEKTSKLVGKRLTLSYVPASQADADTIASYLPKPHADGSPIQPSELPTSLPGYLIQLKAQINLDGQVVAQSTQAVQMGTDLYSTGGFTQLYDTSQWDLTSEETNVAGQVTAIGISAGGISTTQLQALIERQIGTQTKLQAKNITGLTGEQISGDLLSATIWTWFVAAEGDNRLRQNQSGIIETPGLSYGLFHAVANPIYSWGVVRRVTFPGLNLDIGHARNITWSKDNDEKNWATHNRFRGQYMSALEHAVPDEFFNDPSRCNPQAGTAADPALPACSQGVSAVKAIALAGQAGQKIFTITRSVYNSNPEIVSAKLGAHSQSTKDRIQQALDVGYEVSIHDAPITQDGWTGAGFTVIDPATGAGGYLIDGGSNGGFRKDSEAGTSISFTVANPNPTEGTLFLMAGLVARASISAAARLLLAGTIAAVLPAVSAALVAAGPVAVTVLTIALVLLILVVIWQIVAAAAAEIEDIRQQVINSSRTSPVTINLPLDNCVLVGFTVAGVPIGWKRNTYACLEFPSPQSGYFPLEIPPPSPVPCAPGYFNPPSARIPGTPVSASAFFCAFTNPQ